MFTRAGHDRCHASLTNDTGMGGRPLRDYDLDGGRCQLRADHNQHHAAQVDGAILTWDVAEVLRWPVAGQARARLHTLP
jgi:hypothetical protein